MSARTYSYPVECSQLHKADIIPLLLFFDNQKLTLFLIRFYLARFCGFILLQRRFDVNIIIWHIDFHHQHFVLQTKKMLKIRFSSFIGIRYGSATEPSGPGIFLVGRFLLLLLFHYFISFFVELFIYFIQQVIIIQKFIPFFQNFSTHLKNISPYFSECPQYLLHCFPFMVALINLDSISFLVNLVKYLSILLTFSWNQLFISLIFLVIFVSISLISTLIFIVSFDFVITSFIFEIIL